LLAKDAVGELQVGTELPNIQAAEFPNSKAFQSAASLWLSSSEAQELRSPVVLLGLRLLSFQGPRKGRRRVLAASGERALNIGFFVHKIVESILHVGPQSGDIGVIPARLVHARREAADHAESSMHELRRHQHRSRQAMVPFQK